MSATINSSSSPLIQEKLKISMSFCLLTCIVVIFSTKLFLSWMHLLPLQYTSNLNSSHHCVELSMSAHITCWWYYWVLEGSVCVLRALSRWFVLRVKGGNFKRLRVRVNTISGGNKCTRHEDIHTGSAIYLPRWPAQVSKRPTPRNRTVWSWQAKCYQHHHLFHMWH